MALKSRHEITFSILLSNSFLHKKKIINRIWEQRDLLGAWKSNCIAFYCFLPLILTLKRIFCGLQFWYLSQTPFSGMKWNYNNFFCFMPPKLTLKRIIFWHQIFYLNQFSHYAGIKAWINSFTITIKWLSRVLCCILNERGKL